MLDQLTVVLGTVKTIQRDDEPSMPLLEPLKQLL